MDVTPFLAPLGEAAPSGTELRNDARFHAIERMIEPASREARTDKDGTVAVTPQMDWQEVLDHAAELAGTGRDLRLLVIVTRAMSNVDGFSGLSRGLGMISDALDQYWDTIHPELRDRPEPAEAALRRSNALKQLENDDHGLLGDLEMGAVLEPRGIGPITGDDFAVASLSDFELMNESPSGLGDAEKAALKEKHAARVNRVTAACRALFAEEADRAADLLATVTAANAARAALEAKFSEKAGLANGMGLRLPELETFLDRVRTTLEANAADAPAAEVETSDATAPPAADGPSPAPRPRKPAAPPPSGSVPSGVNSRDDVVMCLDMIIAFYERTEPSSPIPHIARRMRRMVPMDFVQLMEEIAPSGMKEFRNIAGVDEKSK